MDCIPENTKYMVTLHFSLSHTLKEKQVNQNKELLCLFLLFLTVKPRISDGRKRRKN